MAELERRGVPRRWFERERYRIPKPSSGGVNFESRRARLSAANNATAPTLAPSSAAPPLAVIWLHGLALCSSSCATDACGACNCALPELGEYDGGFSAGSRLKLPGGAVLSSPHANPDPISVGWLDGGCARAWFDFEKVGDGEDTYKDLPSDKTAATLNASLAIIDAEIGAQKAAGRRVVLAGFSNGAAMALHAALHSRRRADIAGALVWAGYPFNMSEARWAAGEARPKLAFLHGEHDDLVPYAWGEAAMSHALEKGGIPSEDVTWTKVDDSGLAECQGGAVTGACHMALLSNENVLNKASDLIGEFAK